MHTHKLTYTQNGMTRAMATDEIISTTTFTIQAYNSFFSIRVHRGLLCFATLKIENSRDPCYKNITSPFFHKLPPAFKCSDYSSVSLWLTYYLRYFFHPAPSIPL